MRIFGEADEPILIRDPSAPQRILRARTLRNGAVATSSGYARRRRRGSPYIDPLRGRALNLTTSVTVIAPSCLWADALTKILAIDPGAGASLLHRFGAKAFLLRPLDDLRDNNIMTTVQGQLAARHLGSA